MSLKAPSATCCVWRISLIFSRAPSLIPSPLYDSVLTFYIFETFFPFTFFASASLWLRWRFWISPSVCGLSIGSKVFFLLGQQSIWTSAFFLFHSYSRMSLSVLQANCLFTEWSCCQSWMLIVCHWLSGWVLFAFLPHRKLSEMSMSRALCIELWRQI